MFERKRVFKPGFWARLLLPENWSLVIDYSAEYRITCQAERSIDLLCSDIIGVSTDKGLVWHTVEVRTKAGTYRFSGLGEKEAGELATEIKNFINRYLCNIVGRNLGQLDVIGGRIRDLKSGYSRYLAHSDIAKLISQVPGEASQAISHPLFSVAFLPASIRQHFPRSLDMLIDPDVRRSYNDVFVQSELERCRAFFDDLGGLSLSREQREACIRLEDNNLLVASAGSGKSATMVGKVAYALENNLYQPEEILVLAYNKSAAEELRTRISRQLNVDEGTLNCRVTTFHALGRGIIEETEGRPPQLANWANNPGGEARIIDELIEELKAADPKFHDQWIELLAVYPKADVPREFFDAEEDYLQYIEALHAGGSPTIGTLGKIYVKSLEEKRIAARVD